MFHLGDVEHYFICLKFQSINILTCWFSEGFLFWWGGMRQILVLQNVMVCERLSVVKVSKNRAFYSHIERNSHGNGIMEVAAAALYFFLGWILLLKIKAICDLCKNYSLCPPQIQHIWVSKQISENVLESQYISIRVKINCICSRLHCYCYNFGQELYLAIIMWLELVVIIN